MTTHFQEIRKKNLRTLRDMIKKNKDIPLDSMKAMFEFKTGIRRQKTNEYIKLLLDARQIKEDDFKVI